MGESSTNRNGLSDHDSVASATLRFLVEVIAWVAGPWAAASVTGQWWVAIPAAIVVVGSVSVFSTPGDKDTIIVATPGPLRLILEILIAAVAVIGAWIVWPTWIAILVTAITLAAAITGASRARWLAIGAPATSTTDHSS